MIIILVCNVLGERSNGTEAILRRGGVEEQNRQDVRRVYKREGQLIFISK